MTEGDLEKHKKNHSACILVFQAAAIAGCGQSRSPSLGDSTLRSRELMVTGTAQRDTNSQGANRSVRLRNSSARLF